MSPRSGISLERKLAIIKKVEEGGFKKKDIAKQFGVPASTLSSIIKNKDFIIKTVGNKELCSKRKRLRACVFEDIDEAMLKWLMEARHRNLAISGKLMKQKAKEFAELLGHTQFKTSAGWLYKFKQRHGIVQKTFFDGTSSVSLNSLPDSDEWEMNFNVDIDNDGQTRDDNPPSDAEDIVRSFLYNHDEELACEEELINAKESLPTLGQVSSSLEEIRSFLEMKSDVPTNIFEALNILDDFIEGEKFKELSLKKI